ncbi:hypothetical protein [Oceanibacterium hippocampi]|uniref:Uncharacterized protein n=1 Tax=Oceanibacterium hippocampi TaxID=745714 RepID=A0A1Y5SBS9_9PROT|nr:hypothetical protein [Oceanibacterium hippocampi]SLN37193.1 hypothetical protein OCH7691_01514 [Oceanibacterium hippocampi]
MFFFAAADFGAGAKSGAVAATPFANRRRPRLGIPAILLAVVLALLGSVAPPSSRAIAAGTPPDSGLEGLALDRLHWGMPAGAVRAAFGERLRELSPPWRYGPMRAPFALLDQPLAGQRFDVILQIDEASGGLRQVMMQRRRGAMALRDYLEIVAALEAAYGKPTRICGETKAEGDPLAAWMTWESAGESAAARALPAGTTLHATFLDFVTSSILEEDPNIDRDPLVPFYKTRRNNRQALPRRVIVRYHAADDIALAPREPCVAP